MLFWKVIPGTYIDRSMCALGREVGVVSDERWDVFQKTESEIEDAVAVLKSVALSPQVRPRSAWLCGR